MNGNMFYEQNGRLMYGNQYGYALSYEITKDDFRLAHVRFEDRLIMPDDPQNWNRPIPTDLVSEFLFELAKKEKYVLACLYGFWVDFNDEETVYDIKVKIQNIQRCLIQINPNVPTEVRFYLEGCIKDIIKGMPVG